jgi:glycosyltransferase involved in cell wall biosynthesis
MLPDAAPRTALRIGYAPDAAMTNKYAERVIEILGAFGAVFPLPQPKRILTCRAARRERFDLAVLNWIELDLIRPADGAFSALGFLKVVARVLAYRCLARRLVYVRHNNFPHGTRERDRHRARRTLDLLERLFDVVLIHSGHDLTGGRHYVPHPLYRPAPGALNEAETALLRSMPADYYVVFGRLVPYKRIEQLLAHFPPQRRLLIFGEAEDPDYAEALAHQAGANVVVRAGYASEALAQALVRRARGLVLSHADADMIVSGSLFYALSLGVPVFAVRTPTLEWLRRRLDAPVLHLAADAAALCRLIATDPPGRRPVADMRSALEREFGDARIRAALAEALSA